MHVRTISATLCILLCSSVGTSGQEIYALVSLPITTPPVAYTDLPSFDSHGFWSDGDSVRLLISSADVDSLGSRGWFPTIVTYDMAAWYAARAAEDYKHSAPRVATRATGRPAHFRLGSAAGAYTLEEYTSILDSMELLYPELISSREIGRSVQGRPIMHFAITAPGSEEARHRVLMTGLHHAREPVSGMNLIYTMWALLERYGHDPEVTTLLENRVVDFVPVVNPDGYQKNLDEYPQGGGLWRKNLGAGGLGIDLNRNYGPIENWDGDNTGPNRSPTDNNYRGPSPYSEPETVAIRDLMEARRYSVILHHHSFGELLLHDHDDHYDAETGGEWPIRIGSHLAAARGLGFGESSIAIGYRSSGTATEWSLWNSELKGYAWTPETGDQIDGFWPLPSRYHLLCSESLDLNLRAIRAAGATIAIESIDVADRSLKLEVRNVGTRPMIEAGLIVINGRDSVSFGPLEVNQRTSLGMESTALREELRHARAPLTIGIVADGVHDTVHKNVAAGDKVLFFYDDFEKNLSGWNPDLWGIESIDGAGRVLADSPYEETRFSSFENRIELRESIDLTGVKAAELQFDARGVIEARNYALHLEIIDESGNGLSRFFGSENMMVDNLPADWRADDSVRPRTTLRGELDAWQSFRCNLDAHVGGRIRIAFVMETRVRPVYDISQGFLIDNLRVTGSRDLPSSVDHGKEGEPSASTTVVLASGNPRGLAMLRKALDEAGYRTDHHHPEIVDAAGRVVLSRVSRSELVKTVELLPPGIYFLRVEKGVIRLVIL